MFALDLPGIRVARKRSATAAKERAAAEMATDDAVQLLRQDIRSERRQLVAANLPLTDTEATKFWPVYDRYTAELTKLNDSRYAWLRNMHKTTAR